MGASGLPAARLGPGSGRVGPAHPAAALRSPLLLVEPTPGAILLGPRDRVGQALLADGARGADGLGLALADLALGLALAVGSEEENDLLAAARGSILPAPVRPGRQCHLPTYLRHESISSGCTVCSRPGFLPGTRARALRLLPRLSIQRTIRLPCSRANSIAGAPRAPSQIGGRITVPDRPRAECIPADLASSHFGEPTLNDAIPAGGSAAGPENYGC